MTAQVDIFLANKGLTKLFNGADCMLSNIKIDNDSQNCKNVDFFDKRYILIT